MVILKPGFVSIWITGVRYFINHIRPLVGEQTNYYLSILMYYTFWLQDNVYR